MRRQRYELILEHPNFQRRKMISRTDPVIQESEKVRNLSDGGAFSYENGGPVNHPTPQSPMLDFDHPQTSTPQMASPSPHTFNSVKSTRPEISPMEVKLIDKPQRRVIEIRVFYDDQTWDTFVPQKK